MALRAVFRIWCHYFTYFRGPGSRHNGGGDAVVLLVLGPNVLEAVTKAVGSGLLRV